MANLNEELTEHARLSEILHQQQRAAVVVSREDRIASLVDHFMFDRKFPNEDFARQCAEWEVDHDDRS